MSEDELVTVVIPVYKVEKYLDRCVKSVVNQTYTNLEIILVDDESPDRCPEICDLWKNRDARVKVIHKKNAGLGMARNTGIENATGKYICFVDSDDYILANTIETVAEYARKENADITIFGFITVNTEGVESSIIPSPVQNRYCGDEVRNLFLPEYIGADPKTGRNSGIPGSACTCLISMDLIHRAKWRFASERDIISEDVYSILALCNSVNKVVILNESFYCYCANDASLTHSYHENRFEKIKYFYQKCIQLCQENAYPQEVERRCAEPFLSFTIAAMKQEVAHYSNKSGAVKRLRVIVDDDLLQQMLCQKQKDKINLKKRILYWAMRHKCYGLCYMLLVLQNAVKK